MMYCDQPSVIWTDRPAFIEMSAQLLHRGGDWSLIMDQLPKYARPSVKRYPDTYPIPALRGQLVPLRLSPKQSRQLQREVEKRDREIRIQEARGS